MSARSLLALPTWPLAFGALVLAPSAAPAEFASGSLVPASFPAEAEEVCSACLNASLVFIDGFDAGTACSWSSLAGGGDDCPAESEILAEGGVNVCGDCTVAEGELCDDGPDNGKNFCPYGMTHCAWCNVSCTEILHYAGSWCGDGVVDEEFETCDDGNSINESVCPYGEPSCAHCSADCQSTLLPGGPSCGDGVVDSEFEDCDDGNTHPCGTCSSNCSTVQHSRASGMIVVVDGAQIQDGETLTISDGYGDAAVYEFDKNGICCTGDRSVTITNASTELQVAQSLVFSIDDSELLNLAVSSGGGAIVSLTHFFHSSVGNEPISSGVDDEAFVVIGMSGGAGRDCAQGIGCSSGADCLSGVCSLGTCN